MNIIEKSSEVNYLAAMAVFQQMYNRKIGIHEIICTFLEQYIVNNNLYDFLLEDIYKGFNDYYNFKIPILIVKSSLRKLSFLTKKTDGHYLVDITSIEKTHGNNSFEENKIINDKIINELVIHVETKINRNLTETEKVELFDGFCEFLLGAKVECSFQQYISSYVIECSKNEEIKKQLDDINEGLIIYTGITSELDSSKLGSWKNELTLYLDQEILFHIVGYNGEFFKKQADDFLSLVNEINRKEKIIKLVYFDNVQRDVDRFFNSAEEIVNGRMTSTGTTAMNSVTKGRSEPGDIITEKGRFYSRLENLGITCDTNNYFDEEKNNRFCIQGEFEPMLSLINILRHGENNKPTQNIKFILITGTRKTLEQAFSLIKEEDSESESESSEKEHYSQTPLAKSLEDITKLFWFALNKNFGHSQKLTSFDVIHKAKIVLSSILNGKIKDSYIKLNKDFLEGKLTKDVVANCIDELRNKTLLPESIESENVDFVLNLIESSDIEQIQNEKALQKYQLQEMSEKNKELEERLSEKNAKITELQILVDKNNQEKIEEENQKNQKKEIKKIKVIFGIKILFAGLAVIVIILMINKFLIPKLNCEKPWLTLIGWISSIIAVLAIFRGIFKKFLLNPYKEKISKIKK